MEESKEKELAESIAKAIEEDAITEEQMESAEGGRSNNVNCPCQQKNNSIEVEPLQ